MKDFSADIESAVQLALDYLNGTSPDQWQPHHYQWLKDMMKVSEPQQKTASDILKEATTEELLELLKSGEQES